MPAKKSTKKVAKKAPAAPAKKTAKKAAKKAAPAAPVKTAKKAAKKAAKTAPAKKAVFPKPKAAATAPAVVSEEIIRTAAYLNYCSRMEQGLPGDQAGDWLAAEASLVAWQPKVA